MPPDTPLPTTREGRGKRADARPVRIGRYEVVQHIATGGMGAVYRARDTAENNREVALKILSPEVALKHGMLVRFQREARSAAKLRHENIVAVYDSGEAAGAYYMVMEFVNGVDLHDYVKRKGPLDPEEARQIVLQAARALAHAAELNIVHRDIKPSNFLLVHKGGRPFVKLTDFGLAREVTSEEFRVTRAGTTVGTVDYMSPEQARDSSAADARSDLYSLGSTWFHLLTGQAPFPEGGLGERLIAIMTDQPPDVREINPRVSDQAWAVLAKLLEKDPDERYQTAEELIAALTDLEGAATARPRAAKKAPRKPARKARPDEETVADVPAAEDAAKGGNLPYILGAVVAALAVAAVVTALAWPKKPADKDIDKIAVTPPDNPIVTPPDKDRDKPPVKDGPVKDAAIKDGPIKDKDHPVKDKDGVVKDKDGRPKPEPKWPALDAAAAAVDVKAMREKLEKPFAARPEEGEPFVARLARTGGPDTYHTLADAVAAAPKDGRAIVIEIHDNGPLFELPVVVTGRRLSVKAAKGYRPLLVWDLEATMSQRKKKGDQPLVWVSVSKGDVSLEGVQLALRRGATEVEPATLLDVESGDVSVRGCVVSAAGEPRGLVTLARLRGEAGRCRFSDVYARGNRLVALDLASAGGVALVEGCLFNGGQVPLIRASGGATGADVRLVRSTLLGKSLVELRGAGGEKSPRLAGLAWDCLLARAGDPQGDEMLTLADCDGSGVSWESVNSACVGWKDRLGGAKRLASVNAWPEQAVGELATKPASIYAQDKAVGFASSVEADAPLGCPVTALPPARDWLALALEPSVAIVEPPDGAMPEIPTAEDGKYHGGKFDLAKDGDLGAFLDAKARAGALGPKVVMHLSGKGDHSSSPVKLTNTSLVLYFVPEEKAPRTMLKLATAAPKAVLIDVVNGSVEVINGGLKLADETKGQARGAHLIRIKGGDVRLYKARLEGPHLTRPDNWVSALSMAGSGDLQKANVCAMNESVVLCDRSALVFEGVGVRLRTRHCVIVAGGDAVVIRPGDACQGRANVQCHLERTTLAARGSAVALGDAPKAGVPSEPVVIQTRGCVFLGPFDSPGGVLHAEGEALTRGMLLWRSEGDAIDGPRLRYLARQGDALPKKRETSAELWQRLWGSQGTKGVRSEVGPMSSFDAKNWSLSRLRTKFAGADFALLGLAPR